MPKAVQLKCAGEWIDFLVQGHHLWLCDAGVGIWVAESQHEIPPAGLALIASSMLTEACSISRHDICFASEVIIVWAIIGVELLHPAALDERATAFRRREIEDPSSEQSSFPIFRTKIAFNPFKRCGVGPQKRLTCLVDVLDRWEPFLPSASRRS